VDLSQLEMGDFHTMTRGLLIIASAHIATARQLATQPPFSLDPVAADELFVPAGSATGEPPASHFWASGQFTEEQMEALHSLATSLPWAECHTYNLDTDPGFPFALLTAKGLQPLQVNGP